MQASGRRGGERRGELIGIATELFGRQGFAGTSMNDIARAAGIRKPSLYHHFESKEALLIAAVTSDIETVTGGLDALSRNAGVCAELRLSRALDLLYDSILLSAVGRLSPLVAETSRQFPAIARSFHDGYIAPIQCAFEAFLSSGIAAGDFADVDVVAAADLAAGPALSLSLSRAMFIGFEDLDERLDIERTKAAQLTLMSKLLEVKRTA